MTNNQLHHDQIFDASVVEEAELYSRGLSGTPFLQSLNISSIVAATKTIVLSSGDILGTRVSEWDIIDITTGPSVGRYFVDQVIDDKTLTVKDSILDDLTGTSVLDVYYRPGACTVGYDEARDFGSQEHVGEVKRVVRGDCVQTALEDIAYKYWAQKEPTGFVDQASTSISFDDATRTFTIQAAIPGAHWHYYIRGILHEYEGIEQLVLPDVEGQYFIYFINGSESGTLVYSTTPWGFEQEIAFVCIVYWDATNKKAILELEERHGCSMDWPSHRRWHRVTGSETPEGDFKLLSYIDDGDGSLDAHAQFSISGGSLFDEDIENVISHSDTPSAPFEQILSPICYAHVLYKDGANGYLRDKVPNAFPIIEDGVNTPKYNLYSGGVWGLTNVTNGWYFVMWLMATNDRRNPVKMLTGLHEGPDLITTAQLNLWGEIRDAYGGVIAEYKPFKKFIFQASTSFTNSVKARLGAVTEYFESPALNDRYSKQFNYNGNAGVNKYLELFAGQSSLDSPFTFPENSYIRTITADTVAPSTGVLGFYLVSNPATPRFTIEFNNQLSFSKDYSEYFLKGDRMFVKVVSGSFTKPGISLYVQTDTF